MSPTGLQPAPLSPDQLGKAALLTMIVAIIGLLLVVALISAALKRRRKRLRDDRAKRHGRRLDPWVTAGQRAPTPTAEELEDDAGASP